MKSPRFKSIHLFCGPPSLGSQQIFGWRVSNDVISWFDNSNIFYVHKARVAIRKACDLLRLNTGTEVLVPSYNCGSEIDPLIKSGASVKLFRVDQCAVTDINDIEKKITRKTKAVYIIHYFGFPQPVEEIKVLCIKNSLFLIEDCALSLFSSNGHKKLGTTGDIAIFNFPKTLPVPDGGILLITNPALLTHWKLMKPASIPVLGKMLSVFKSTMYRQFPILSSVHLLCNTYIKKKYSMPTINTLQTYANSLPDIPENYYYDDRISNKSMSSLTKKLIRSFDVDQIIARRRENFIYFLNLVDGVKNISPLFSSLPDGVCPLAFPIKVRQRNQLCEMLNRRMISAFPWWAGFHRGVSSWGDFPDALFLKNNILALPIHQDLNYKDIEFMFKTLLYLK